MYLRFLYGRKVAIAAALALSAAAHGATIFSENFNAATPGPTYGIGNIAGTGLRVSGGNIDIFGNVGGNYFSCNVEPNNNCLDLNGSVPGTIETIATYNLVAGSTYSATFRSTASGAFSSLVFNSKVLLGSQSLNFTDTQTSSTGYLWTNRMLSFVAAANENNVRLSFQALNNPGIQAGALIDDIVLTESAGAVGTPEPGTAMLGAAGLAALFAFRRKR